MIQTYSEYLKEKNKKKQDTTKKENKNEDKNQKQEIETYKSYIMRTQNLTEEEYDNKAWLREEQLKRDEKVRQTAKKELDKNIFSKVLPSNRNTNTTENTWINKNAKGSTLDKIVNTSSDVVLNLIKGVIDTGDFIGDLGSYGVAGVADVLGFDDYAKTVREGAQVRLSNALLTGLENSVDQYSLLGEKTDNVISSVGQSYAGGKVGQAFLPNGGNIPLGKMNLPTTAVLTGMSSSMTEAYQKGANNKQALIKGITGGLIEGFSEGMFGLFGQGGSEFEDVLTRTLTKNIENQVMRKIAKTGISAIGEGVEEIASYTLNWIADNGQDVIMEALGADVNKMGDDWSWDTLWESFLSGAMAGGTGAGASNITMNKTQNQIEKAIHDTQNSLGRTLTRQEQGVVSNNVASGKIDSKKLADTIKTDEEVVNALTKERMKESKGKSYQDVKNEVIKDLEQGDIDINKINEIIGGKDYQTYQQYNQEIDELANRRKELKEVMDNAKEDSIEYKNAKIEYDALQEQINNYDTKTLKGNIQNLINDKVLQNGLISNSYRENANRSVKYTADLSKYNDKEKAIVQKAIDSGVLNNTRRTHILVDMVAKLASDKGLDFDFTNNKNLQDTGFTIEGKVIDGYVTGNNIALNVESPKALNKVVGHEIAHVLEGTELYDQLKTAIEKYAELKGDYKTRLEDTKKRYKDIKDADVEKEVVADLVGEYIFNDPKFVQQLSTEQPGLFKKIFNEIKYLCKVVTAGSQEAKQLEKVKKIFEDAYRENSKVSKDTKFAIENIENKNYNNHEIADGIFFNEKGLFIEDKQEYAIMMSEIHKVQSYDLSYKGMNVANTDLYYYIFKDKGFDKTNVVMKIRIKGNEEIISLIESEVKHGTNNIAKGLDSIIESIYSRHNINNSDNVNVEKGRTTTRVSEVYSGKQKNNEQIKNNRKINANSEELDNSSFSFEQKTAPLIKAAKKNGKVSISEQLENQASKVVTEDIETRNAMLEHFKSYLEENDITNPTQEDIDNSLVDILGYDNELTPGEKSKEEKLYKEVAKEYLDQQGVKYSVSESTKNNKYPNWINEMSENEPYYKWQNYIVDLMAKKQDETGIRIYKINDEFKMMKNNDFRTIQKIEYEDTKDLAKKIYDIQAVDSEGRTLTKKQVGFFKDSKVRDKEGNLLVMYHGTKTDFNVFDKKLSPNGFFFATKQRKNSVAGYYAEEDGNIKEVYLDIKKPLYDYRPHGNQLKQAIENGTINNYDGVIAIASEDFGERKFYNYETGELDYEHLKKGDIVEVIVFNSNQIKNVDNTNPTSDPDIRYSVSEAGTHGTLMAIHNLDENKLKGVLELGGFPVPSIAIVDSKIYPHENFGNISVLFNKETINPSNKLNEVYPSDIYSTRFPDTTRKINTETIENIVKDGYDYGISMSLQRLESLLDDGHFDIDWVPEELMQYYFAINGIEYTEQNRDLYENGEKRSDYIEWLDEIKEASIGETRIIRPDVDLFTPSGNRRTLDQRSLPYTLENIVKIMTKKRTRGSEDIHYVRPGLIRGNLATKFKSIEDIKKNQNKLITYEEMETLKKEVDNKFYEILDDLERYHRHRDHWLARDDIAFAINETAKSKVINESVLKTKLEESYIENVPKETLTKVIDFLNELKYAPTEYFEAKPQRAVGLDEVQAIVLPNYTSTKLKQQLQEAGLRYYEYDPNISGDRQRVIDQFDDLKFSLSNSNEQSLRKPGDIYGSDIKYDPTKSIIRKVQKGQILNPNEISKLTPEDANTTPLLPKVDRNKVGDGDSKFASNIKNKTKMLTEEQREILANEEEVAYYDKVTNKESLEEAYGRLVNGSFETEKWFSKPSENATAVDVAEGWILLKQYADNNDTDGMVEVAKKLRDMGTKAGQTVQAFNIMSRLTPEGMVKYAQSELMEAYDKMVKHQTQKWIDENKHKFDLTPDEVKFIMDTMQEVSMMEDGYDKRVKLAEIQKLMTDKLPPAKGAGIKSWMRISMLFNPKTQVRNVAGNAIIAPVNYFGDMFASGVDKLVSQKTGVRTTGTTKVGKYTEGFKTGLYQSYNDFKKGINTRNLDGNRFEIGEGKSFNNNKAIGKALNKVDSLLSFMLDAGDRGFYEAAFTNSINNQMVLNNTTEVTQEMIDIATQEALSRTWQDNNGYTKFVINARNGLNQLFNIRGYGLGDILIPFAKTPANLTKAIVDYSPVGLVSSLVKGNQLKNAIKTGQFTPQMQHEFVQSLGKATAGTMLYVLGVALAKAGVTSGESDEDKDVANFLKNTLGVSSYSIKIGDKTFTYDWAQPVAAPLTITANIVNAKDNKGTALFEAIVGSMDSAGSTLLEQSFLQSINDVLNNNDGVVSGLITEVLELPSRAIPTLSKQIVDLTDKTQRQTFAKGQPIQSAINAAKAKIPGLSQTLAPQVDTLGREIQRYGGKNNLFNVFLNPANVNTENISEAAQEIYDVYSATGDKTVMPRVVDYTYKNKDGVTIPLTTQQRAELQKATGQMVEANVLELMNNGVYNELSDADKAAMLTDIVNYSYNIAKHEVLGTDVSQTYSTAYIYSKMGDVSDYYLLKLPEFIADVDEDGNSISGSKKAKVVSYINSLPDLNKVDKAIMILISGSSLKGTPYEGYDSSIISYIRSKNLTEEEYEVVFTKLGYKYQNGRVYKK